MSLGGALVRALLRLPDPWLLRLAGAPARADAGALDPACQLLARRSASQPHPARLPPEAMRAAYDRGMTLVGGRRRPDVAVLPLAAPGPAGEVPLRLYRPPDLPRPAPLLLFFHQGGFVIGTPDWCEPFCTLLAGTARCLVASVAYRRAPEHRFPAAHEDARAALRFAAAHAAELGADPARIAVGGESAGGNLAAFLCAQARRDGGPPLVLQLLVYPWVEGRSERPSTRIHAHAWPLDQRLMDRFTELAFESPGDLDDPRMNPLHADDLAGLPPALVHCAGFDPLADQGRAYAEKLAAAGVPATHRCWQNLPHSFLALGAVPAALRAQQEIARQVRDALRPA
jgi:acetyl esterase